MANINYNSVFDGVTLALHKAFPSANIHGKEVKQDMQSGDFIVLPIIPTHKGEIASRAKRSISFDVIYFPTDNGGFEECLNIYHVLPSVLGEIETSEGDILHGTDFQCNIEDEVLHCIVSYTHFVYEPSDKITMEAIKTIQEA